MRFGWLEKHLAECRQGVYLTWQSWSYSQGEAVESSGGRRLHRSVPIHLKDIRQPEVLLQRQPEHNFKRVEKVNYDKSCREAQANMEIN